MIVAGNVWEACHFIPVLMTLVACPVQPQWANWALKSGIVVVTCDLLMNTGGNGSTVLPLIEEEEWNYRDK